MPLSPIDIIETETLPANTDQLLEIFGDSAGNFSRQEGSYWDFKREWPDRTAGEYFGAILRLVCAFHNTFGGMIIFGVDDKTRVAGFNKINPDLDAFSAAVAINTGKLIDFRFERYYRNDALFVDILLIPRKLPEQSPVKFLRDIGSFRKGLTWVRKGHEVIEATPQDIPILFCQTENSRHISDSVQAQIPPNPSTMKTFVGRLDVLEQIFSWLRQFDEPRTFLWGKGGSGKSTIAYEVAKTLRSHGKGFRIDSENELDQVIYISAKKVYLNTSSQKPERFEGEDFHDERSLLEAILILGSFESDDDITNCSIEYLKKLVVKFFDINSCFIVIDDIDTLTTAKIDSGMEFLYRCLARAKKPSKILYTLRNRPNYALNNSIEVPGLGDVEYIDFINECCLQFKVPKPDADVRDGRLRQVSECRPLVIESVIALRRRCGNFETALNLFDQAHSGDITGYIFEREWNSLSDMDRGREVLAILALYKRPITFEELCTLARIDQQKIADALAAVEDMFLTVDNSRDETTYSLGELTRSFVLKSAPTLNFYPTLKARVEKFKTTFHPDSPEINRIKVRLDRAVYESRHGDQRAMKILLEELDSGGFSPSVTEDPRFLAMFGYVAASLNPPRMDRARSSLEGAFSFRFAPDEEYVRKWFEVERNSDQSLQTTKKIEDLVWKAKRYSSEFKWEIRSRRASFLYNYGRMIIFDSPTDGALALQDSIKLHLFCYRYFLDNKNLEHIKTEERARNTSYFYIQQFIGGAHIESFSNIIEEVIASKVKIYFDPIVDPFQYLIISALKKYSNSKPELNRLINIVRLSEKEWTKIEYWCDLDNMQYFKSMCGDFRDEIQSRIKSLTR